MGVRHIFLFGPPQEAHTKKPGKPVRLLGNLPNDVFLSALLEMPTTQRTRRNPLKWAGATVLHMVVLAALIIVPLYTTGTIHLNEFEQIPLVAPPPPPAPPLGGSVTPHIAHPKAKLNYTLQKLTAPIAIPKNISSGSENAAEAAPDLGGVESGVPGGFAGGVIEGTGLSAPPPPPPAKPTPKIVRIGSNLKAPRQVVNVDPLYPDLARQVHLSGTVLVDAVIDERGNVVQARAVSGHPLLVAQALKAVLQWKYEPTTLNGRPVSVEMQVQVHFNLNAAR